MKSFRVDQKGRLLETLFSNFPEIKKTKMRQYLRFGSVEINGQVTTRFDAVLNPGDEISIRQEKASHAPGLGIHIVYEDEKILVIDKPPGLLTVATEKEKTKTAYRELSDYLKSSNPGNKIFIIHRLDRDASGLVVFAKNEEVKYFLQTNWEEAEKKYFTIVEGSPKEPSGTIESYLTESKSLKVFSGTPSPGAKYAVTRYRVLRSNKRFSLLEVQIDTGRKHQIRVHMADLGCPIVGDEKYGSKTDPLGRLGLHAFFLTFPNPDNRKKMAFELEAPVVFKKLLQAPNARA